MPTDDRDRPPLSPTANRLLDEELREIAGDDRPIEHADRAAADRPARHGGGWAATLSDNRIPIAVTFVLAVVVGAIVSLVTGSWWLLAVAILVHGVGTLLVTGLTLGATTETEHASPALAEQLEREGVSDPDRLLTDVAAETIPQEAEQRESVTPTDHARPVTPRPR
jgi:hypothetical protein